ncbi:MAG: hypothetical protein V4721_13970 [Bacteroidota bacterium]
MRQEDLSDQEYIELLEERIAAMLDEDSVKGMYYTLNAKLRELNRVVSSYKIEINDSESKAYERFWKTFIDIKEVAGNVLWLKTQIFGDTKETVITNPMEKFAKSKKLNNEND